VAKSETLKRTKELVTNDMTPRGTKSLQVAVRLLSKVNGEIESFLQVPPKVMRKSKDKSD
jgi:hypothetical protein